MDKEKVARELVRVAELLTASDMSADELLKRIESAYRQQFPRGHFEGKVGKFLGVESIFIRLGVQNKSQWANGIFNNDPAASGIIIEGVTDGKLDDVMLAEMPQGGSLMVKPDNPHMAYGRVKIGWRKKKGSPEQILKHLSNYFKKMRQVVNKTRDQHAHEID